MSKLPHRKKEHPKFDAKKQFKRSEQLCWNCKNFAGGCSWSREFVPVEGWEAELIILEKHCKLAAAPTFTSYAIKSCPEFVEG